MKFETELWIGGKYHGIFSKFEDMLEYGGLVGNSCLRWILNRNWSGTDD